LEKGSRTRIRLAGIPSSWGKGKETGSNKFRTGEKRERRKGGELTSLISLAHRKGTERRRGFLL